MQKLVISLSVVILFSACLARDIPDTYERYKVSNAKLSQLPKGSNQVVLMGDSITELWEEHLPNYLGYIDRGIWGQVTDQMLKRFSEDVIALSPSVVVILGGVNDLHNIEKYKNIATVEKNLQSMYELARKNNITVLMGTILPVCSLTGREENKHASSEDILAVNGWIRRFCKERNIPLIDYFSAVVDKKGDLESKYSCGDCLHMSKLGYSKMLPLLKAAIAKQLNLTYPVDAEEYDHDIGKSRHYLWIVFALILLFATLSLKVFSMSKNNQGPSELNKTQKESFELTSKNEDGFNDTEVPPN